MKYKVFIAHSSRDTWVARQIEKGIREAGAETFIDANDLTTGDNFNLVILRQLREAQEFVVLFTPAALQSDFVKKEIGAAWGLGLRTNAVLYGIESSQVRDLISNDELHIQINEVDRLFGEISERIKNHLP